MRVSIFVLGLVPPRPSRSRIKEHVRRAQPARLLWVLPCVLLVCHLATAVGPAENAELANGRGARTLWIHSDGTYEYAYAWQYGGCLAPDLGSFA